MALFWRLIDKAQPALYRVSGPSRPLPIVEDMAVSPEVLPDFLVRMQNVLKRHQVTASLYCHAGQGQLHVQPFLDLANADDVQRMRRLAEELYQEVFAVRGSISGEHGCGLSRTAFVRRQAGELFDVFLEVKRIFDPDNILNPGKIVGDDPDLITRHVRPSIPAATTQMREGEVPAEPRDRLGGSLALPAIGVGTAAVSNASETPAPQDFEERGRCGTSSNCSWIGSRRGCATPWRRAIAAASAARRQPKLRMCPLFRVAPAEEASPRAKANLIRGVLAGTLDLKLLTSDEFKAVADLCVHCHSCRLECPAEVDIPRLMRESKGAYVAANGLPLADWAMTRLDLLGAPGQGWSPRRPIGRWRIARCGGFWRRRLGIAQGRRLPQVASRSFLRRAARRRLTRPSRRSGQKVLYFVDVFANYFDPQLAEAMVAVLEHNGVSVYVHPEQEQAAMASIALRRARLRSEDRRAQRRHPCRRRAARVSDRGDRAGRGAVPDAANIPSWSMTTTPGWWPPTAARQAASSGTCTRSGNYNSTSNRLNLTLGYHTPCHLRALGVGSPGESLLGLIPGLRLHHVESGCSGMAGTYGLLHKNYRSSLRVGLKLIARLRDPDLQAGATECSTCKMQMEQGTTKPTIHPIKLLALSYGLMPEIARLLTTRRL